MDKTYYGINLLQEDDFSAFGTELKLWSNSIPLRQGDTFPTDDMKYRANINMTMDALVSGEFGKTLQQFIQTWPDVEPITNRKITNIVANLPIFGTIINSWRLLLKNCIKNVEVKGVEQPKLAKVLIRLSDDIIMNKFCACDRVTHVYAKNNKLLTKIYSDKNIVLFRTTDNDHVVTISNIIEGKAGNMEAEFISYLPTGEVIHDVFEYGKSGKLGKHTVKNEVINATNSVVYSKNGINHSAYGYPEISGSISAALGVIRAFAVLANLNEKKKEMIRVVPDTMVRKDPYTGATAFVSGGTGAYDSSNPEINEHNHDVEYVTPDLKIDEAIDTLDAFFKQVTVYSGLSGVILGTQNITGRDSGRAIIASCVPTMIRANGYLQELVFEYKEIIQKIYLLNGEDIDIDDVEIVVTKPNKALTDMLFAEEQIVVTNVDPAADDEIDESAIDNADNTDVINTQKI